MESKIKIAHKMEQHCQKLMKQIDAKGSSKDRESGVYAAEIDFVQKMNVKYSKLKLTSQWQPILEEGKDWLSTINLV